MPIKVLYEGRGLNKTSEPEIDIVAVHGLNPLGKEEHALSTWRKPNRDGGHLWLQDADALPKWVPNARTIMYIWNSKFIRNKSKDEFIHEAVNFFEELSVIRHENSTRPLILVGHSLGGILIKQALVFAHANGNEKQKHLIDSTFALVFLGLLIMGSTTCAKLAKRSGLAKKDLLAVFGFDSMFRDILEGSWKHQLERYKIISCYESDDVVVSQKSAILGLRGERETVLRIDADHSDICRFDLSVEKDRANAEKLMFNISRLCEAAMREDKTSAQDMLNKEILQSLSKLDENPRLDNIEQEHFHTLQWSGKRGGPGLVEWLHDGHGIFWINGKPGAGKSTLMKYLCSLPGPLNILSQNETRRAVSICFFFHELGIDRESKFVGLLNTLLSQLLSKVPELIPCLHERFQRLIRKGHWSESDLRGAFDDIITMSVTEISILCFVDGLDECVEESIEPAIAFFQKISRSSGSGYLRFLVLCSSRPDNKIEPVLSKCPTFKIQDFTKGDIEKFVRESIHKMTSNLLPGEPVIEICHHLIPEIVARAEGVFIWAKLVVSELITAVENDEFRGLYETFDRLPSDLEALYARIFSKIPPAQRHHTINYLQFFVNNEVEHGPRNLLGMTLALDLTLEPPTLTLADKNYACTKMKRRLQNRCRGFMTLPSLNIEWKDEEVFTRFCKGRISVHKTVVDYIFTDYNFSRICSDLDPKLIVERCTQWTEFYWRMLQFDVDTQRAALSLQREEGKIFDLLVKNFFQSIRDSENKPHVTRLAPTWLPKLQALLEDRFPNRKQLEYFFDSKVVANYIAFERHTEDPVISPWHSNILSFAVSEGLLSYVEEHTTTLAEVEKDGRPLLHYALKQPQARDKELRMVQLLLSRGCRLDWSFNFRNTWEYFLINMYTVPAQLESSQDDRLLVCFLEYGADPNQHLDILLKEYGTDRDQYLDSRLEHYRMANVGQKVLHHYQCFPLHVVLSEHAMPYDRLETVLKELLSKGADVTARDSNLISPIKLAERNWPQAVPLLCSVEPNDESVSRVTLEPKPKQYNTQKTAEKSKVDENLLRQLETEESYFNYDEWRRPLRPTETVPGAENEELDHTQEISHRRDPWWNQALPTE